MRGNKGRNVYITGYTIKCLFVLGLIVSVVIVALFESCIFAYTFVDESFDTQEISEEVIEVLSYVPITEYVEVVREVEVVDYSYLGEFTLTAYCPCSVCCGQWGGSPEGKITAIGVGSYSGVTVAVDPTVIPYGTKLYIEGVGVVIATDCGGAIKGNRIDVYFENHDTANEFGVQRNKSVYIVEDILGE